MNKVFKFILDLVFPIKCVGCGKEGEWVCLSCILSLVGDIRKKDDIDDLTYVDDIFYFYNFNNHVISRLIHFIKYDYAYDVARFLVIILHDNFIKFINDNDNVIFVPIPLYKKRFNERGFNQSRMILDRMGDGIMIADLLKRIRDTGHQASLSADERSRNLKDAFCLNKSFNIDDFLNCDIVLFDDVVTTGNTIDECAKILRNNGFKNRIIGLAVAG